MEIEPYIIATEHMYMHTVTMKLLCQKCCSLYMHDYFVTDRKPPWSWSPQKHMSDPASLQYDTCMLIVLYTICDQILENLPSTHK